ncbi:hypothetical protein V8F20_011996 [Naviculisporaceae sp. PSN 640]
MDAATPTENLADRINAIATDGCNFLKDLEPFIDWYDESFRVVTGYDGRCIILTNAERFELVSSLYGPGNMLCWFFLVLSVLVSWTANPVSRRKDTITNDFIAVLTMPLVAVVHFFYIVAQQRGTMTTIKGWLGSRQQDDVKGVGALEAPLTVCEDFIACAAVLVSVAAGRDHPRRLAVVLCVGLLCLAPQVLLLVEWLPYGSSALLRPFIFHSTFFFSLLLMGQLLTPFIYLAEVGVAVAGRFRTRFWSRSDAEHGQGIMSGGMILSPGYLTRRMSAFTAAVAAVGSIFLKYVVLQGGNLNSVRFIPRSPISVWDLDQAVAAAAGLVSLGFSIHAVFKERKKARESEQRFELSQWRRWAR